MCPLFMVIKEIILHLTRCYILIYYFLLDTNSMLQTLSLSGSIKQAFISSLVGLFKYHLTSDSVNLKVISTTQIAAMYLKVTTNNPGNSE